MDGLVGLVTIEDFELMGIKKEEFGKDKVENGRKGPQHAQVEKVGWACHWECVGQRY
jgi:hypothetical protein